VPPFVLTVLKIVLLLLLYFFVWRAVRAVVLDLYGGRVRERRARPAAEPRQKRGRHRALTSRNTVGVSSGTGIQR
jgi:hypothetical protein